MSAIDLAELCAGLDPAIAIDRTVAVRGVNTLALADHGELCFAEGQDQASAVRQSAAAAVLVPSDFPEQDGPMLIRCEQPRRLFFSIAERFLPMPGLSGIHPSAVVDTGAELAGDVAVAAGAVIVAGARIGEGCQIGAGCFIGAGVELGAGCVIEANVTLHRDSVLGERCVIRSGSVIGGDGFGFEWDGQAHRKVPQLGRVVIEDDVDIGCNCCVDRATLGETRIRRGTKVDNLVQLAHNTDIGAHVILVSQSGVAGSSTLGTGVVVAGQVAVSDHVKVGAGARIGGQSGVTKDIPAGSTVFGTPARPMKQTLRELAALADLPALRKRVKEQERLLETLVERLDQLESHEDDAASGDAPFA